MQLKQQQAVEMHLFQLQDGANDINIFGKSSLKNTLNN
jgi:hypothetical protein